MNHEIRNRIAMLLKSTLCFLATAWVLAQAEVPQKPQTSATQLSSPKMTEEVLGELNVGGYSLFGAPIFVSPDGSRVAWVQYTNKLGTVVVDGQPTPGEYYTVSGLSFSQDNKHVMISGSRKKGVLSVIVDGKEVGTGVLAATFNKAQGARTGVLPTMFNTKGQVVQLVQKEKKKVEVLVDGIEITTLDLDQVQRLVSGGDSIAVLGMRKGKTFWVLNGTEGPAYDVVGDIAFSANGQRSAHGGANNKGGWVKDQSVGFLVVDGKQVEQKQGVSYSNFESSGGGFTSYHMSTGFRSRMDAEFYGFGDPVLSPDGRRIAYAARTERQVAVFVDREAGPSFDTLWAGPVFTSDGKHHGYVASTGSSWQVVLDHKVIREFTLDKMNFSDGLVLSQDGTRTAFIAGKGGQHFFSFGGGSGVASEDGTPARRRVVIDDKQLEEHDCFYLSDLQFSSDSRHSVYAVHGAKDKAEHIVVDGQDGKIHQQIVPGSVKFVDEHTVTYVARNDTKIVRVTWKLD